MINEIDAAVEAVRRAAREQSDRIVSELNADYDARNVALTAFSDKLKAARSLREQADSVEREACEILSSVLVASGGVSLSLINQIRSGRIITGIESPTLRQLVNPPTENTVASGEADDKQHD